MNNENGSWSTTGRYNISRFLKLGKNMIHIYAEDAGTLPCGALAELKLGNSKTIITDKSWLAIESPVENWYKQTPCNTMSAAIAAPYGQGAWGKKLQIVNR